MAFGGASTVSAQKRKAEEKAFEEATARRLEPEVRVFIRPMVCDLKLLTTDRETFGPYPFTIKGLDQLTEEEFLSIKSRALYQAAKENEADAILEPLFYSYCNAKEPKTMYIELSGYPVKYINFHPLKDDEVDMVEKVYTRNWTDFWENKAPNIVTTNTQNTK